MKIVVLSGLVYERGAATGWGSAGAGKSTVAHRLETRWGFTERSIAEPMKDFCAYLFGWDHDTLYGDSALREKPDLRHYRADGKSLTPRYALKRLGDWGRECCPDIWVRTLMDDLERDCVGLQPDRVVISDARYLSELESFGAIGATLVRIKRELPVPVPLPVEHSSERNLLGVPDSEFHYTLEASNVPDLEAATDAFACSLLSS